MATQGLAKRKAGTGASVLLFLVALLHGGCFVSAGLDALRTEAPALCASGERQVFLGADFLDDQQGIISRLIFDPMGVATLRIFNAAHPLDEGVLFRRQDCSRFQASLERNGWRINEIYDLRVSLEVDCRTTSGDTVQGALAADHCH